MLIFDQLKKDDPQLRFLAFVTLGGLMILLAGLWWVQVVSTRFYRDKLEGQSIRTIRIPAVRGKILDREGRALAENEPRYNIAVYLEELSTNFQAGYASATNVARQALRQQAAAKERELGRKLTPAERKQFSWTVALRDQVSRQSRYQVTSNLLADLAARLHEPLELSESNFDKHYDKALAIPLTVLSNLTLTAQIAMFEEQSPLHTPGMDLDVQSVRSYTNKSLAAHVIGYLRRTNGEDDSAAYNYRLDDYSGVSGIEKQFDAELRGTPGEKAVLVNNYGYRQGETVVSPAEAGNNVKLTLDIDIQEAAEIGLKMAQADVRGAVVVMDARSGDILAMASAPTFDPNHFMRHPDPAWDEERWSDAELGPQKNKALQENYRPGSTFKILIALSGLEQGTLDPAEQYPSTGEYPIPGKKAIGDTAGPGLFDLNRAMAKSSNPYFITQGVKPGVLNRVITLGQRLHLGEKTGLFPGQETPGLLPSFKQVASHNWYPGDTMYLSIGQGFIDVTPLQMAVLTAAVANGGTVYWPRIVSGIKSPEGEDVETFPEGRIRDYLRVNPRNLEIVRRAMLEDVVSPEGSGRDVAIPGWQVAGKTGTAQVEHNNGDGKHDLDSRLRDTWFVSFAPYENPRYVVVAFVEGGASGAKTCVPVVKKVYEAIVAKESRAIRSGPLAEIQK